ncbi:hypothetical protein HPB50_009514 [Hyalomma asiaticum]|uniref:Uncharacterized protein n=1 Tax=Hyalomma asiaticum TaxID=266040 RepID=A0ACB7RMH8_HYAAI|nr:hypothetical protein HPB50_009514 [Hyalomma asiaticum]
MALFQGVGFDHLVPCTASEGETCQIVTKLATWNRLLRGSLFEIHENPETHNQLCVTNVIRTVTAVTANSREPTQYSGLLAWLFTTHRCIGSVKLPLSFDEGSVDTLLRAVCQNKWIKTLSMFSVQRSAGSSVYSILPHLTTIQTLYFSTFGFSMDGFVAPLSALLQASSSLKSLHLRGEFNDAELINTLFTALLARETLTELEFRDISDHVDTYPEALRKYLSSTTALKVLHVDMRTGPMQMALLEGVLESKSIHKFSLDFLRADEESTAMVSRILKENRVIRTLTILSSQCMTPGVQPHYNSWILSLLHNDILEEVRLPWGIVHPTMWSLLFRALPSKEKLKLVHIDWPSDYTQLRWVCAELKDSGSEEKVSLRTLGFMGYTEVLHCKAFSSAMLSAPGNYDLKLAALLELPTCQHLKSVVFGFDGDCMGLSLALAEFLASTTTLERLYVHVAGDFQAEADSQNTWWNVVIASLSRNRSLRYLSFPTSGMSVQDIKAMADAIKQHTSISQLWLGRSTEAAASTFFRHLSERIEENYRLTVVEHGGHVNAGAVDHWNAVKETAWRNSGIVARAARIRRASHFDRYVTGALERAVRHPALFEEVARSAKVDKQILRVLVRDRLSKTQSLDGFMRVVRVVKERVVCHPAEDGRMQLDDLNEDCWSLVRRYVTGALERIIRCPALLDEAARSAKLDAEEFALVVRERLRGTRSLDGFMQVVGAVKERVVCRATDDGRTQLDDLNEDC